MKTKIGTYDPETLQVPVTFDHNGVKHQRRVNACLDDAGAFDAKSTAARVAEVALGVAQKIALGVIVNQPTPE